MRLERAAAALLLVAALVPLALEAAQRRGFRQPAATVPYDSHFVFTRIRYGATFGGGRFFGGGGWEHDYPTAERNFAAILDYITNMRVRKDGSNILDLEDPRIFENPVLYMSEPGYWSSNDAEAKNLRAYLLKGGLIIFDDFEGEGHWRNLAAQMRRALPDHHFIKLDVTHPVFQSFFSIEHLNVPHPTVNVPPSFLAMFDTNDPSGRMLALANWNNDLGDYWEWSAEGLYGSDPTNDAYRLGVNYLVYAMTH
ncbi:MAG: hypothetical protein A3F70_08770 [Acidobacteria bacterium RIFCSPLOWO2_12_FULL_67_14]|nr:MAG: hypothetical protein A3H29_15620 [Acidobacteria bacterium RIFCSPLOWO2_02_FULL_67_21]OFW41447.1 MAG: hypothetical protein A3F70_08770 [Acidobacteria bacterium RIFCSPLOWO2_12_FULL_67_14]